MKYETRELFGKEHTFVVEDKQDILTAICEALRHTSAAGSPGNNALAEIRYEKTEDGNEYAIPIFADGNGAPSEYCPHGYYAVNITADSGIAIWRDVTRHFVERMW